MNQNHRSNTDSATKKVENLQEGKNVESSTGKLGKRLSTIGCILVVLVGMALVGYKLYRVHEARKCGILLAFDDYNPENWEAHYELFEKYHVPVTFFVTLEEPTDFCFRAVKKGHEIGFHTIGHKRVTELSEEERREKVTDPIAVFEKEGIRLTSFAYPYGAHKPELDEELLRYYKIVRGAYSYELHSKADLRHGYVDAYPIDNYYFSSDEEFRSEVDAILQELHDNVGAVTCMYSHAIDGGDWCVTQERLEYLLKKAREMGLEFYTFQELQDF